MFRNPLFISFFAASILLAAITTWQNSRSPLEFIVKVVIGFIVACFIYVMTGEFGG